MSSRTPEIHTTAPTPSASMESFETAASDIHGWNLTPYHFNFPHELSTNVIGETPGHPDSTDIGYICVPEYHLLVDHALGVLWKGISNGQKNIGELTPQQVVWAIKFIESHQNQHNSHSEDIRMIIQYLQEIVVALSASPVRFNPSVDELNSERAEPANPMEDSFVLANMTSKSVPSFNLAQEAVSTPLPGRGPNSVPRVSSSARIGLIQNLHSLQDMLVRLRNDHLRWNKMDMQQLAAMERMLQSMAVGEPSQSTGRQRVQPTSGSTGMIQNIQTHSNDQTVLSSRPKTSVGIAKQKSSLNC